MTDKNILVNFEATFFTEFALSKPLSITSKYFKYSHLRLMNEPTQIIYTAHAFFMTNFRPDHVTQKIDTKNDVEKH